MDELILISLKSLEIKGVINMLNASNNSIEIVTSKGHETRIFMNPEQVKHFIPYLYKKVKLVYNNGLIIISEQ